MNFSRLFKNTIALSINTAIAPFLYGVVLIGLVSLMGAVMPMDELTSELFAVAVGCVWSVASINYVGSVARSANSSLVGSFVVGIYRLPSFLCALTIVALLSSFGMLCLLAPGLYAVCRWGLAPILVASEDIGFSAAFDRSDELTAGFRWQIFGLLVSWWALVTGIQFAAVGALMACLESFGANSFALILLLPVLGLALQWLSLVGSTLVCDELDYASR